MISYLLPTRDRPDRLAATLRCLARLDPDAHAAAGGAEVVVVDDASRVRVVCPPVLANGMPVRVLRRPRPEGAAARNTGARVARGSWLVMLDDDSAPRDDAVVEVLAGVADDVAAIGADIVLPDGRREAGGLPEVFVGCGAAVRRDAFLDVGGYDPRFHYYAEEYDLCARLLLAGWRVVHDWRFRVRHEKVATGRDMDVILHRLVRNSGWVVERYAPASRLDAARGDVVRRYAAIARKERAEAGYARGLAELRRTRREQLRRPLDEAGWDRFCGRAHVRAEMARALADRPAPAVVIDHGKHAWVVRETLAELGTPVVDDPRDAGVLVLGTLSPGPMMDAFQRRRARGETVVAPWWPQHAGAGDGVGGAGAPTATPSPAVPAP